MMECISIGFSWLSSVFFLYLRVCRVGFGWGFCRADVKWRCGRLWDFLVLVGVVAARDRWNGWMTWRVMAWPLVVVLMSGVFVGRSGGLHVFIGLLDG